MPIIPLLFALLILLAGSSQDSKELIIEPFPPISKHAVAWDNDHKITLSSIQKDEEKLIETVEFYRSQIDKKLSEDEMLHLVKEANRLEVPVEILLKLLKTESNFTNDLVGPKTKYGHAYGMAQFMKNTAPWIAKMADLEYEFEKLFDTYYSITLAATYLHYLQYGDDIGHEGYENWHSSLTAYNRGMGGLRIYERKNQTTISSYSEQIISDAEMIALNSSD